MTSRTPTVAIVDYSLGNLFSVQNACGQVGLRATITSSKRDILSADGVILPGVGAFGDAMDNLRRLDLISPLRDLAQQDKPLIGICLGQQLLMSESHEFGRHKGLDIFEGEVIRFDNPRGADGVFKVPQVGWNRVVQPTGADSETRRQGDQETGRPENARLLSLSPSLPVSLSSWSGTPLESLPDGCFMYFVHSFHVQPARSDVVLSTTRYGHVEFSSSLRRGNVVAFQFHPERSGRLGLKIYQNLARMIAGLVITEERAHAA